MPKKRRGGRVTPGKRAASTAVEPSTPPRPAPGAPAPSGRYTPKTPDYRLRPRWHRLAGWLGVSVGVAIIVANDAMFIIETHLLPFGHSELYLFLGVAVGGASTWFLGLFDRGHTIYE